MHLIGLDIGTTGCKAVVFDLQGRMLGRGFREYGIVCDAPAKAEQDAERVWTLTKEALAEAVRRAGVKEVKALSLSVQGDAIIPVDGDFRALHPAILGMDYRSRPQADRCEAVWGGFGCFQRTGMRPHPMNSLTKVLWLRELAPAIFDRAARIVTYADFILGKLGGEAVLDETMASRTMAFDLAARGWNAELHAALGLSPAIWSRPVPSGTPAGRLRRELAAELGLPLELMLVAGGHDQTCAALGAGVVRPGMGVVSTGTAEVLATAFDRPMLSEAMFESYYPCYLHARPGMYFTFSLNHCGGLLLRWWRDNLAGEDVRAAGLQGMDAYQFMDAQLPDGPAPVMFLPHLSGSGTPRCDLQSKGALVGLTLATRRPDIFKAILEGLAFELRANLERLAACGLALEQLVAVGGGARSRPWLQLKADILNRPLRTLECHEAACLGAALLAGTAAGAYANLVEAVAQTVRYEGEFNPVHDRAVAYAGRYALFQELYPALRSVNQSL